MLILPQNNIPWQYLAFLLHYFAKSLKNVGFYIIMKTVKCAEYAQNRK